MIKCKPLNAKRKCNFLTNYGYKFSLTLILDVIVLVMVIQCPE